MAKRQSGRARRGLSHLVRSGRLRGSCSDARSAREAVARRDGGPCLLRHGPPFPGCWLDDAFVFDEGFLFFARQDGRVVRLRCVFEAAARRGAIAAGCVEFAAAHQGIVAAGCTLLASLLQAVGIEAYPVLMNSSRHIDPDVPSPGQFDHVITAVPEAPNGGRFDWLDTTAEVAPYGYLIFNLRNKQALVIPTSSPATLMTTPADPPFPSFRRLEIDAKLSETGVLEGKMRRSYRGDSELIVRGLFRQVPQSQWKDLAQGIAQGMGYAGDVSEVEAGSPEDTSRPFEFSNKYTRKDYPDWANRRITPPLGILGFPAVKDEEEHTQPILLGGCGEIMDIARVELPKGYAPRLLPGVDLVRDFAEYHSRYTFKDGVFTAEVRVLIKQTEVALSSLKDYQSFQKAISDDRDQYTELVQGSAALSALSPSPNKEAADLVQEARQAARQHDLAAAADALQRAVKVDAQYKDAWQLLGSVRLMQGRNDEGFSALRKAIEVDPKDTRTYKVLGFAYMHMRRQEDAIPVWRDLLKQDPDDADAHANLGNVLLNLKRYGEAVPELEAAVALNKPSAPLEIALGRAYIGAGTPDKAVPLLKKAGEASLNLVDWNNAAYYLADNNLELLDAQRYAEKAVRSVEDDAANMRLDKLDRPDLDRMTRLANFWDTLGWVYFRQGDLTKAQKYLEAAWNLDQTEDIGDHLAQVYEKQGKKGLADHQHVLAKGWSDSGFGGPPALRHRDGTSPTAASGPKSVAPVEELSEMRRTKLGTLSTKQGSAEFFVLLVSGGKVEDVKFISGAEHIRSLGNVLRTLTFKAPLPDDSPVKLVRRGVLVCAGGSFGCDFTLFTVDSVHSTE